MTIKIFYNETELNGRFQVMANIELTRTGIKKYGSNHILTHNTEIFKNLNNYWVSKEAFENIKQNPNAERTSF